MPKPNQKTITIRKDVYKKAEKQAKKERESVAAFVTNLILEKCEVIVEQKPKEA